jgi:hypothetical protein
MAIVCSEKPGDASDISPIDTAFNRGLMAILQAQGISRVILDILTRKTYDLSQVYW